MAPVGRMPSGVSSALVLCLVFIPLSPESPVVSKKHQVLLCDFSCGGRCVSNTSFHEEVCYVLALPAPSQPGGCRRVRVMAQFEYE